MNWELIWKAVFVVFASLFAVMSVLVTFLGARDVKRLLKGLQDSDEE